MDEATCSLLDTDDEGVALGDLLPWGRQVVLQRGHQLVAVQRHHPVVMRPCTISALNTFLLILVSRWQHAADGRPPAVALQQRPGGLDLRLPLQRTGKRPTTSHLKPLFREFAGVSGEVESKRKEEGTRLPHAVSPCKVQNSRLSRTIEKAQEMGGGTCGQENGGILALEALVEVRHVVKRGVWIYVGEILLLVHIAVI